MTKDPVCGMDVNEKKAPTSTYEGNRYAFCGPGCKEAFDRNPEKGKCPLGHLIGLNVVSEVSIQVEPAERADLLISRQLIGTRRGLLRPRPIMFASPRLRQAVVGHGLTGWGFEVAHGVPRAANSSE